MSGHQLIALLEKYGLGEKADKVWAVIKKGLNTYAPSGMLATGDPVIEPKYFIQVIQKSNSEIMDRRDGEFGDDQNIGLHDLVSQMSMRWVTTTQNVTVNGHTYSVRIVQFLPLLSISCGVSQDIEQPRLAAPLDADVLWGPGLLLRHLQQQVHDPACC